MHNVTVLVTFDFDAETGWKQLSRVGPYRGISYESQGAFGPKVGIWRVLALLELLQIKSTFFVPGWVAEHWTKQVSAILKAGHEVALHGYLHENVYEFVGREDEEMVLERGIAALKAITGPALLGYRPPAYIYSEHTTTLLKEHGFLYGSAMQDDDAAYIHQGVGSGLVEIPVFWHLTDDLFGWHSAVHLTPSQVEEHWVTELRELGRYPNRIFVLTLHPEVIGHPGRLAMLQRVLSIGRELNADFRRCDHYAASIVKAKRKRRIS